MGDTDLGVVIDLSLEGLTGPVSVETLHGLERVSHPFRYRLDFHAQHLDMDRARGRAARVQITERFGGERFVHGVVQEVTVRPTHWRDERHAYSVVIVPEAYLLSYRHGFEVFQGLDVRGICARVFERAGLAAEAFAWRTSARYPTREMCAQYDESEWAFVSRLLEEEGIWYRFQHDADRTTMVFGDDSGAAPRAEPDPLSFDFRRSDVGATRAHHVEQTWSLVEGAVELDDYDGLLPSRELRARARGTGEREWFEYPGGYATPADGARLAAVRLAERAWPGRVSTFDTTSLVTTAGTRVTVAGAPMAIDDGFIVENELSIRAAAEAVGAMDETTREVTNRIVVIAADRPFRPRRETPRPHIAGPQTARVVGPADQEVWVDEHGRVKLQFHWDRRGQLDEQSSYWVPVAHGHVTGAMMLPRIGWEVVVEFRHGNPDRPVVTGRIYNPFFPPPHALPERRTVTSLGTDTLPGREGVNELRFEDRAGEEHLAVTAARDLREHTVLHRQVVVRHDETREVGADRIEVVGVLRGLRVDRTYGQSVGGAHSVVVGNDRHGMVHGNVSEQIQGDLALDVTNLYLAQIGSGVAGTLFSALREPVESPADTVLDAVVELLQPARDAVEPEAGETGSSQELWSEAPGATSTLGPVLGGMTAPPTEARDSPSETGGSASAEGGGELGEAVEAFGEVIEGMETAGEWAADPSGPLEDLDLAVLEDILPFAAKLIEVGASALGANEEAGVIAKVVSGVRSIAESAKELGADASALELLDGTGELASAVTPETEQSSSDDPLAFVAGLVRPVASAWEGLGAVVGDIDAALQGIVAAANVFEAGEGQEPEPANHRASWSHPYEREATHFAATVAAALIRGEVRDDRRREREEEEPEAPEEEGSSDEEETTHPAEGQSDAPSSEADEPDDSTDDEPERDAANAPQGEGTWTVRVGGNTTERVAGVAVTATAGDMRIAVGGNATETQRLARFEQVGESRAEVVRGNKHESTGRYVLVAPEGIELHSDDTLRIGVDGDATSTVGGGRTLTAGGRVEVGGGNTSLEATDTITFECGAARVCVSADGISIEGTRITIRGDDIGVDSPALG